MQRLYQLDARKIVMGSIVPIGCVPYQTSLAPLDETGCAALPNQLAIKYNGKLRGIDECGHGYVPSIGGFSNATSSPGWSSATRTLSPTVEDSRLWSSELDSSRIASAMRFEEHGCSRRSNPSMYKII
ncbi:GDSL esterase/lipase [Dendrobium catenatum]|uniref:GDSL esterase/lipase n=1 Tax=Dendrobium catenatum TaxID=906689 RepID=A0A2I0VTQ3_9ASPA|nr:GDSL esterase/lipase [Dendrobium catenatum]